MRNAVILVESGEKGSIEEAIKNIRGQSAIKESGNPVDVDDIIKQTKQAARIRKNLFDPRFCILLCYENFNVAFLVLAMMRGTTLLHFILRCARK